MFLDRSADNSPNTPHRPQVRFGGVENYLVAAWTAEDLEECRDLNLPCADASAHLPRPLRRGPAGVLAGAAGEFTEGNYLAQVWLKPAVVAALLEAGFTVHSTGAEANGSATPTSAFAG